MVFVYSLFSLCLHLCHYSLCEAAIVSPMHHQGEALCVWHGMCVCVCVYVCACL